MHLGNVSLPALGLEEKKTQPELSTYHSVNRLTITIRGPNTERNLPSPSFLLVLASHEARKEALKFARQGFCNGQFGTTQKEAGRLEKGMKRNLLERMDGQAGVDWT